ncbi:MAG: hypothetical protein ACRDHZ_23070 [Ktedonobacteraceae bacterium]
MNKRSVQKQCIRVLLLSTIILLVGGGVALLNQWQEGPIPSHASDDTVVGPPSLPAATVDTILRRIGSPMAGTGSAVEAAARAQNIDDAFGLAVWWTETNDGAAGVGLHDLNPGSVRGSVGYPSAYDGYTIYPSYSAAVTYWFGMLKRMYINRGLTTVFSISHPYVGTSTSNLWAGKVVALMSRYRAEAPPKPVAPPPPAVTTMNPNIARHAQTILQQQNQDQGVANLPSTAPKLDVKATAAPASASGLSGNIKLLLVLFNLLATLGLGLAARNMRRRYASNSQIADLLGDSLQAKIRAGFRQSAAFLPTFTSTETWRTTEDLKWPAPMTGALATTNVSSSDALLSLGAFMATQTPEAFYTPHPQYGQTGTPWPQVNTPVPDYSQVTRLPGLGLPSRPMSPQPNVLPRTRLLSSYATTQTTDALPDKVPQLVGVGASSERSHGLLSRYREAQGGER